MPAISFPYRVTLADGVDVDVVASAPDLIRMESRFDVVYHALLPSPLIVDGQAATYDRPLFDAEGDPIIGPDGKVVTVPEVLVDTTSSRMRTEYVAFMAWSALRRARDERIAERFETFRDEQLAGIVNRDGDDTDDEDLDPEGVAGSAG
jgi:hypothetical protein